MRPGRRRYSHVFGRVGCGYLRKVSDVKREEGIELCSHEESGRGVKTRNMTDDGSDAEVLRDSVPLKVVESMENGFILMYPCHHES